MFALNANGQIIDAETYIKKHGPQQTEKNSGSIFHSYIEYADTVYVKKLARDIDTLPKESAAKDICDEMAQNLKEPLMKLLSTLDVRTTGYGKYDQTVACSFQYFVGTKPASRKVLFMKGVKASPTNQIYLLYFHDEPPVRR